MVEPDQELVPLLDVVVKLRTTGLTPEQIADALSIPVIRVRTLLLQSAPPSLQDQDLADSVRLLTRTALSKAHRILSHGTRQEQLQVIKQCIGIAGRSLGKSDEGDVTEGRMILMAIYENMRTGEMPTIDTYAIPSADDD